MAGEHAIRSYVLRQGRVSNAQARAYTEGMPKHGVPFAPERIDLTALFGRQAPKVLEIGSGMGETTALVATANPHKDYLAIEVHTPGVGSLLKLIDEQGIKNLKVIQHDAVEVLTHMIGEGTLSGIHVFFPDPWPKKRHHKRRLIQPPLVALLASRLEPQGVLHLATDWEEYAVQMLEVLGGESSLENTARDFAPRPASRPVTKFETRGLKLGHQVWDLVFRKKA
jgi:tRNA (guanine-N7-)-methyltransferase